MKKFSVNIIKRFFDFIIAATGIIFVFPVIYFTILVIRIKHATPVFFSQDRAGLNGKTFTIYKFRTMNDERDTLGNLLPDTKRLTRFGKFLRNTSMDELPELINVLKGDMSLVGPRPLLIEYLPLYNKEQARRHEVRPGITGWAQVNGRNALSWEEKFKLDAWYVDNRTFLLDLKIILLTIWKVLKRDGISAEGEATMPRFTGSSVESK